MLMQEQSQSAAATDAKTEESRITTALSCISLNHFTLHTHLFCLREQLYSYCMLASAQSHRLSRQEYHFITECEYK